MFDDIKIPEMLNKSKQGNFVFAPVGNVCNVQIFDKISLETSTEMVGNLASIITQLPTLQPIDTSSTKITSPYDIPQDRFVFDVSINSGGGEFSAYKSIASMFALAKSRGAIIRTTNTGRAHSAASMLAIQGTPGYRIMHETSSLLIHFGDETVRATQNGEAQIAVNKQKQDRQQVFSVYDKFAKIPEKQYKHYLDKNRSGTLFAQECLEYHICDWILTHNGELIGRKR